MNEPRAFTSATEAIETGLAEGAADRKNGFASEEFARELREAFKWQRGPGAPFHKEWRRGFAAGFLGVSLGKVA
jgi:hypothetical protein